MAEVRDIVRGLKKKKRLIFMSSHILPEVTDVCDEVALIDKGKLLFYDTLENVTSRFSAGVTAVDATFLEAVPPGAVERALAGLSPSPAFVALDPRRVRFQIGGGPGEQSKILKALVQSGLPVVGFQASASALEEVYLSQISKGD
jgi:ABC-2 type transport system ATP-binding protein